MDSQKKIEIDNKYSKGKIYKIVCDTTGLVYIGSTIEKLSSRISKHRYDYKRFLNNTYHFLSSFKVLENNNYKIILIENVSCNSKEELEREERKYIETMDCVNKNIPTRTYKEWTEENKDYLSQQQKEYYEDNKDKILEQQKQYYENNKDKILEYQEQYREENKDKITERDKQYYLNNKDKILEYNKQKVNCDICDSIVCRNHLARHKRTLKCIKFQKLIESK